MTLQLDLPEVVAEVVAAFEAYEAALRANDVAALQAFFVSSPAAVRLGLAEHGFGMQSIAQQRHHLPKISAGRRLYNTVITTLGTQAAAVSTESSSPDSDHIGRQTQTWVRVPSGWKILTAHVSVVLPPVRRAFDADAPVRSKRE